MRRAVSLLGAGLTVFFVMFSVGPAVLCTEATARAADAPPAESAATPGQRAKQHYLQGEAYFKSKNFSEAMDEYQKGYLEKPDPVFIFNIAQCQRLLGNSSAAVEFYQRYLKEAPSGPGRPVAEKEIAELRGPTQQETPPVPEAVVAPQAHAAPPVPPGPIVPLPTVAPVAVAPATPPPAAPPPEAAPAPPPTLPVAQMPAEQTAPVYVATQAEPTEPPVYKRWYFWTAIGVLVLSTVLVAAATSSNRPGCDVGRVCK